MVSQSRPATHGVSSQQSRQSSAQSEARRWQMNKDELFGSSLALINGDIIFTDTTITENGVQKTAKTLKRVTGKNNLLQALELRVLTPFSSDPFNTTYGLDVKDAFTLPGNIRMVKELLKLSLVRTLATDPRVRDIRDVVFEDDPGYLLLHPQITVEMVRADRHSRFWRVDVIIDTIDAQTETLSLNIGV